MTNMTKFTGHMTMRSGLEIQSHASYIVRTVLHNIELQNQVLWYLRFLDHCDIKMNYGTSYTTDIDWNTISVALSKTNVFLELTAIKDSKQVERVFPIRLFDRTMMIFSAKNILEKTKEYMEPSEYESWVQSLDKGILNEV